MWESSLSRITSLFRQIFHEIRRRQIVWILIQLACLLISHQHHPWKKVQSVFPFSPLQAFRLIQLSDQFFLEAYTNYIFQFSLVLAQKRRRYDINEQLKACPLQQRNQSNQPTLQYSSNSSRSISQYSRQKQMISEDQIRLISSLLLLIPLSFFLRFIKPTHYRYLYSLVLSILLQAYVYRQYLLGLYVQSLIVFVMIRYLKSKKIGAIVTFQSMIFLSGYHIKSLIYNYGGWTMDASALLMILVCKYSLLAYAIQDGLTNQDKLTEEQKNYKLNEKISFYDYFGYLNFLPTSVIGPPLEFKQYKKFMQLEKPYDQIPDTIKQTLTAVGHAAICAVVYALGELIAPASYLHTDEFFAHNAFYVLFYSCISMFLIRFKYYFGWKLIIASVHASGVSYNGDKFKLINTCSPVVVETDKHVRNKISHWNIAVQQWLRKCVYQRSPFKGRGVSQLWVFLVSSFWHGFYAGYYLFFFLLFVQVYTQGEIFRFVKHETSRLRNFYKKLGFGGNLVLTTASNIIFSHNAALFILLDYSACFRLLEKVNYIPQTILITLGVTFTLLNIIRSKKTRKGSFSSKNPATAQEKSTEQKTLKKQ